MGVMPNDSGISVNIQAIVAKLSERLTQTTTDLVVSQCGNDALLEERSVFQARIADLEAKLAAYEEDKTDEKSDDEVSGPKLP